MTLDFHKELAASVSRPDLSGPQSGPFWRQDDPQRNEDGKLIRGGMLPYQRAWWRLPNFVKVLVAGYGSGKTINLCKRAIASALQNAPVPVTVVSPTFALARHTTIQTLCELLSGKRALLGEAFWWMYFRSTHEFKIRYKGRSGHIIFYSGERLESLRGPNLGAAYIDEPFIMDEEVFAQMVARVRHPDAAHKEICLSGTPEQLNWGYDLCLGKKKDANDVGLVRASTRDNVLIDPSYTRRLEAAYDPKAVGAYVDGKFVNLAEGVVYYGFSDDNVQVRPCPPDAELGVGIDFNVNPMSAAVFWRAGDHMHFIREYQLPNADTPYLCSALLEDFPTLHTAYPDATGIARATSAPAGKTDFWYIQDAGLEIVAPRQSPKRRDRYNATNAKLSNKTITISPDCSLLIKYLRQYSYERLAKDEHMSHLLDAFSYPVCYLYPVAKENIEQPRLIGH